MSDPDHLDITQAAQGFSAMGSEARMDVLRHLVKAGQKGLVVGDIQERTGIAASTLAHHLKFLSAAGLIVQEKQGRSIISRANYEHLSALASFILNECCVDEESST